MATLAYPTETLHRLTDVQRKELLGKLQEDGFFVLPGLLPADLMGRVLEAIDRAAAKARSGPDARASVKVHNIVDVDPAFRELMMYEPALQLSYDCFGPAFHLCQSNLVSRPRDQRVSDFVGSSPWHADGPRPNMFPAIGGTMGLHYLKFGYFLTDLTHKNGGSLQVVRGSHLRPELDGVGHGKFKIENHRDDLVQIDCPAGTVIAFHQAQWHAAPPNESEVERKNCYVSYCPTWMKPLDRDYPAEAQLQGCTAQERWLLGEPRPALRWWLPSRDDMMRMNQYAPDAIRASGPAATVRYE